MVNIIGLFTLNDVESMVSEIIKMQEFDHRHVLSLIGVCLDAGPGVSIVMPFMINGSLLDYLRKERNNIFVKDSDKVICYILYSGNFRVGKSSLFSFQREAKRKFSPQKSGRFEK